MDVSVDAGSDITIDSVDRQSDRQIVVFIDTSINLTPGSVTVTVTGDFGRGSGSLTITAARPPGIETISPNPVTAGTSVPGVAVTGVHFTQGNMVDVTGGITVSDVQVSDDQNLTLTLQIPACTSVGSQQMTVSDTLRGTSRPATLNVVNPTPTITQVSPSPWEAGFSNVTVTIQVTGFGWAVPDDSDQHSWVIAITIPV